MPSEYTKKRKPLPKARKRIGEGHPGPFPRAVGPPMTKRYALPKPPPSRKAPRRLTPRPPFTRTAALSPPRQRPKPLRRKVNPRGQTRGK